MVQTYRTSFAIRSDSKSLNRFRKECMSKDGLGSSVFDFEKVRPRNGRSEIKAWGCDSSVLNYEHIIDSADEISFTFETESYAPILVLFKFYTSFRKASISVRFVNSSITDGGYFFRNVLGQPDTGIFQTLSRESSKDVFALMAIYHQLWADLTDDFSFA